MKNSKKIMAASVLLAAGFSGAASAHTQSGAVGSSANGNAATDVYIVTCSNDGSGAPAKLYARVADLAPVLAPQISIQSSKGTASSPLRIDTIDGGTVNVNTGAGFSASATLAGGAGDYTMKVNKSASTVKGSESYIALFHCQTADGTHTGTDWIMTQNQ